MNNIQLIFIKHFSKFRADPNFYKILQKFLLKNSVKSIAELMIANRVGISQLDRHLSSLQISFGPNDVGNTEKFLMYLLKKFIYNFRTSRGENLLHLFVRRITPFDQPAKHVLNLLLDSGLPINKPNHRGFSPLLTAIRRDNNSVVKIMVARGANVNEKSHPSGLFPLYRAVQCNNIELVEFFLDNGAEVNAKVSSGRTALHLACFWSSFRIISLLLNNHADVMAVSKDGKSPFYLLDKRRRAYQDCIYVMVKEFCKLLFNEVPIPEINVYWIASDSTARLCYETFMEELEKLKKTVFYGTYSYLFVLNMAKNIEDLSHHLSEKFIAKFTAGLSCLRCLHYECELEKIMYDAMGLFMDREERIHGLI